jgi:hypothetical protein
MVAPKYKAIELTNRQEIKDAVFQIGRLTPDTKKLQMLMDLFNEVHGAPIYSFSSYNKCADCQRILKSFWTYVIEEWNK